MDIGSNTVQLLLAEAEAGRLSGRENYIQTTRLGAEDAPGLLSAAAIDFTATAVAEYLRLAQGRGAERVRIVATSAVRDARNSGQLLAAIRAAAPESPPVEIVSGQQEAALSLAGARASLAFPAAWPVIDIGGSSSELIYGCESGPPHAVSADVGAVRATVNGWPRPEIYRRLAAVFRPLHPAEAAVGVGGTITAAAGLTRGLTVYDRSAIEGLSLERPALADLLAALEPLTVEQRCAFSPLLAKRGEIIVAGLHLWLSALEILELPRVLVTGGGLLDGALAQLATAEAED